MAGLPLPVWLTLGLQYQFSLFVFMEGALHSEHGNMLPIASSAPQGGVVSTCAAACDPMRSTSEHRSFEYRTLVPTVRVRPLLWDLQRTFLFRRRRALFLLNYY